MEKYKEIMDRICKKYEKYEDMVEYRVALEDLLHKVKLSQPAVYNDFIKKLEAIVYEISESDARKKVISMRPFGEHWSYETVKALLESKGIYKNCVKYYLVLNTMYNDYYDVAVNFGHQNDTEFYYELANAFINDEDADEFKVEKYYM